MPWGAKSAYRLCSDRSGPRAGRYRLGRHPPVSRCPFGAASTRAGVAPSLRSGCRSSFFPWSPSRGSVGLGRQGVRRSAHRGGRLEKDPVPPGFGQRVGVVADRGRRYRLPGWHAALGNPGGTSFPTPLCLGGIMPLGRRRAIVRQASAAILLGMRNVQAFNARRTAASISCTRMGFMTSAEIPFWRARCSSMRWL